MDIETAGLEGGVLTEDVLQQAATQVLNNFGTPNLIFMGNFTMNYSMHPEYEGTYWADVGRMSKREHATAKLHTFLSKLKVLELEAAEWDSLGSLTTKRLKRAKWARYQKSSK